MASKLIAFVAAALAITAGEASPTAGHNSHKRSCVQIEVPVPIDTTAIRWQQPRVDNNIDAVDWVRFHTTRTTPNNTELMMGRIPIKGTFKITGQLCVPPKGAAARSDILHVATHGAGFDSRYWDAEIKREEYSYVDAALAEGYSIFTYDRLGTGSSEKPDPYDVVQVNIQVEILRYLTELARSGKLVSASKTLGDCPDKRLKTYKPSKIVHVGHSLGSIISVGLITNYPTESDGLIATGFVMTNIPLPGLNLATWGFEYAPENDPVLFGDRKSGTLVPATKSNMQLNFLRKGTFEPALLDYAWKIRQPVAVSEFASLLSGFGTQGALFKGPLHMVVGENDYGACGGDCTGTYDLELIKATYKGAADVDVHIQPKTGHGLTLSTNATAGYQVSFDFLHKSGL
ncbi:Alpha/beta hydrolase family-domain-containing protein [Dichotomopilus funicola]|uniref:Alpha/beta hydrolase family-domain-containing protein n=1 Tax=Dichotomopilus funicola TaxID=1934379 RepID=A0AAN6ZIP1_9PEZI|nr:Alpha/beta hydrolase family-domain-containing protein [Dichotomopilus funicola]